MGLLKKGKGLSKRTKKTIRRSLSGVCMVSAIIVALVPAQVSEGYSEIPAAQAANNDYSYGIDASDDIDLVDAGTLKLDLYDPDTETTSDSRPVYTTKYVRRASDGSYEYGWQFKIYRDDYMGTTYGVICGYNSSYQANTLEISKSLPYEYTVVTQDEYNEFYGYYQTAFNRFLCTWRLR